jgi:hypothetical protein
MEQSFLCHSYQIQRPISFPFYETDELSLDALYYNKEMEAWYTLVRNMKDESSNAFKLEEFVRRVFHDLSRKKLKEKVKFRQRMGPEFISWSSGLEQEFAKTMVTEVLNDDTFWEATLQVTGVL